MAEGRRWARGEFCWYELGTTDPKAAQSFYSGVFDWGAMEVPMPGGGEDCAGGSYTLLQARGQDIAGAYKLEGPMFEGVPPHWLVYIATDRIDGDTAKAKEMGGSVMLEPMDVPGVGRVAVLRDPQGAAFGLFQAGEHEGSARLENTPNMFCWSELDTTDTAAAKAWYTKLFGWGSKSDASKEMQYTEWLHNGRPIGGLMALAPEMGPIPPNWMNYITVGDCDATVRRATALGGKALVPPTDIEHVGRFSILMDPQGAAFAVIKLEKH